MERVCWVEDPNTRFIRAQGIVGVGVAHPHVHIIVPGGASAGPTALDRMPPWVLPARPGPLALVPPPVPWSISAAYHAGQLQFFGDLTAALADAIAFSDYLAPLRRTEWVGLRQAAIRRPGGGAGLSGPATPTVSPSPTAVSSRSTTPGSLSNGRTTVTRRATHGKVMTPPSTSSSAASLIHVLPSSSTASDTTACSPMAAAPRTSPGPGDCSTCLPPPQLADTDDADGGETAVDRLSLPVLWRAHDHHRDVRARLHRDIIQRSASGSTARDRHQIRITVPSLLPGTGGSIVHPPPPRSTHHHDIATRRRAALPIAVQIALLGTVDPARRTPPPIPAMPGPMQPTSRLAR